MDKTALNWDTPRLTLSDEGHPVPSEMSNQEGADGETQPRKNSMATAAKGKGGPNGFSQLFHEAMNVCRNVVSDPEIEELNWLTAAKSSLAGSKLPFSDSDLKRWLAEAKSERLGRKDLIRPGEKLSTRPTAWLWEGIVQYGTLNWVHALPKVGKTRLMLAMLGAFVAGKDEFLGQKLRQGSEKLLLLGPDMPENIWTEYLRDAGLLAPDNSPCDRILALACSKHSYVLDQYWLAKTEEFLAEAGHGQAIVLLDSFAAATATLPFDENKKEIATPLYALKDMCAAWEATLIVIHHSRKGEAGKGAVSGSRGNSALTAAADNVIDLRRFQADGDSQKKIEVVVEGRHDADGNLLFSHNKETKEWICHGSTLQVRRERAQVDDYLKLTEPQTLVLHTLVHRFVQDPKGLSNQDIRKHLEWGDSESKRSHLNKILAVLVKKGFATELSREKYGRFTRVLYGPTAIAMTTCSVDSYPEAPMS